MVYAYSRDQAAEVVRRALEFVLEVRVVNVSGLEQCFSVCFDRGVMNGDEVAEVVGECEVAPEHAGETPYDPRIDGLNVEFLGARRPAACEDY